MAIEPKSIALTGQRKRRLKPIHVILLAISLGAIMYGTVFPSLRFIHARSWPSVPCEIAGSSITECGGTDTSYYLVTIRFCYSFLGRPQESTRYSIPNPSIMCATRGVAEEVASRFPSGKSTICFLNPDEPAFAVLNRDWSWEYLNGFGIVFLLAWGVLILRLPAGGVSE